MSNKQELLINVGTKSQALSDIVQQLLFKFGYRFYGSTATTPSKTTEYQYDTLGVLKDGSLCLGRSGDFGSGYRQCIKVDAEKNFGQLVILLETPAKSAEIKLNNNYVVVINGANVDVKVKGNTSAEYSIPAKTVLALAKLVAEPRTLKVHRDLIATVGATTTTVGCQVVENKAILEIAKALQEKASGVYNEKLTF